MSTASRILINYLMMVMLNVFTNVNLKDFELELFFSAQDRVVSAASKRIFDCVTLSGTI